VTRPNGPEAPRGSRGASPWLLRFYDETGAYVAAVARISAIVWSVVTGVTAVASPFFGWNVAAAAALALASTAFWTWLGFFYLANPEWRPLTNGDGDGDAA
jgi:hypothetical protein